MVKRLIVGYADILAGVREFCQQIAALNMGNKLGRKEFEDLRVHYRGLKAAVNEALVAAKIWNRNSSNVYDITPQVHFIVDHAKFTCAVGSRDVVALAYKISELAGTGKLDPTAHHDLQWQHCCPIVGDRVPQHRVSRARRADMGRRLELVG